ncbi:MAG TPA: tripartite tricarboxylate transporter substrate binding protein [Burkholderiales bacterium]|nr:tripartite tricarboxylate transporter substrate binding protein [Burkholderiales bacterium]
MSRRQIVTSIAVTCVAQVFACTAWGQAYPSKPVRMIVASSAGSNPDTIGRVIAQGLSQTLGQQVVVDDRAGAGGNIGADIAAKAAPDGYTIFLAHTNHSINASLYRKLNYDLLHDFTPLTLVATSAFVAVVHPSLPVKTVRDLLNIAKARPGDLNYASAGTGSGTYFAAEYFNGLGKVKMQHVGYAGGGPALTSVLSGETSVYFTPLATGLSSIRSARLRALGVTSVKRVAELPDVPTIADTLPGYEVLSWAGLMAPVKTPKDVSAAVHKAALAALNRPDVRKRFEDMGFMVVSSRPEEMEAYIKVEIDKYAKLIRDVGMALQ